MNQTFNEQEGQKRTQQVWRSQRKSTGAGQPGGKSGSSGAGGGTGGELERVSGVVREGADLSRIDTGGILTQLTEEVEQILGAAQDQLGEVEEFKAKLESSIEVLRQRLAALRVLQPEEEPSDRPV